MLLRFGEYNLVYFLMVILQICLPEHGRMIDINSKQKVELHLDSDIKSHPNCVHGPTLLFSRFRLYFIA